MNSSGIWYAGQVASRRGRFAPLNVVAMNASGVWEHIPNPRKLFPKNGQVELVGASALASSSGDWLVFRVEADSRPGSKQFKVGVHRILYQFADMRKLGTIEAARYLFTKEGWADGQGAGHWAIRFAEKQILALHLVQERDGRLRCIDSSLARIECYQFDDGNLFQEPSSGLPERLYDLEKADPLATYDWSPGADYVEHVVRSLAGADDPFLSELIAWLELHTDEETGRISVTGTEPEPALKALRSGELAARLAADREVMSAYLNAVRTDPAVEEAVDQAVEEEADKAREVALAAMAAELEEEREVQHSSMKAQLSARKAELEEEMRSRLVVQEQELSEALESKLAEREQRQIEALNNRIADQKSAAEAEIQSAREAITAEIEEQRAGLTKLEEEHDRLIETIAGLRSEAARHEELADAASEKLSALQRELAAQSKRAPATSLEFAFPQPAAVELAESIDLKGLGEQIAQCVLLTDDGKRQMFQFAAYLLAGEVPIIEGRDADGFSFIAESLIAPSNLVPFDLDPTVITPEDIWLRPGSGVATQVAQATELAAEGRTFLVQLRRLERSAARMWYPALTSLTRRGLLPRPLLVFATLADPECEEALALPKDACRLKVENAIGDGAALLAPGLLSGGVHETLYQIDPGERPTDLLAALLTLQKVMELGAKPDIPIALRLARIVTEAMALSPDDPKIGLEVAKLFCVNANLNEIASGSGGE